MQTVKLRAPLHLVSRRSMDQQISPPAETQPFTHLALHTSDGVVLIAISEIIRVASDSNYCLIYCADGQRHLASRTLRAIEALLPADQFARVHQSHLVRITQIKAVHRDEVALTNGDRLPLSRGQRNPILTHISAFAARI